MRRYRWVGPAVILASGGLVAWDCYQFQLKYNEIMLLMRGWDRHINMPIGLYALPTGLFLAAALLRRESAGWQLFTAGLAVLVSGLQYFAIDIEMRATVRDAMQAEHWGDGLLVQFAWVLAAAVAFVTLAVSLFVQFVRRVRRARRDAEQLSRPPKPVDLENDPSKSP